MDSTPEVITYNKSVVITTVNYPLYYPSDFECTWYFTAKDDGSFVIHFTAFDTQRGSAILGMGDIFTIGTGAMVNYGSSLHSFSSTLPSNVVVVIGAGEMWLHFVSDVGMTRSGFQLLIERIPFEGI